MNDCIDDGGHQLKIPAGQILPQTDGYKILIEIRIDCLVACLH